MKSFERENRLRHVRFRVLTSLLYDKSHVRPEINTVLTSPTKLTKSCQTKSHRVADSLEWLKDMGYLNTIEWGYGRVLVEINLDPLQHLLNEPEAKVSATSFPSTLSGGAQQVITQPSLFEEDGVSLEDRELIEQAVEDAWTTPEEIEEKLQTLQKELLCEGPHTDCGCSLSSTIILSDTDYEVLEAGIENPKEPNEALKNLLGETTCQEILPVEPETTESKTESKTPSGNSTRLALPSLKLRLPSTTD